MPSHIPPGLIMAGDGYLLRELTCAFLITWHQYIYSHPMGLVSTLMAVNNSGLAVATVQFSDWWNHLRITDNLFWGFWNTISISCTQLATTIISGSLMHHSSKTLSNISINYHSWCVRCDYRRVCFSDVICILQSTCSLTETCFLKKT